MQRDIQIMIQICSLPSGSNDWKTLLACSDGDSGPTRDISYREVARTGKDKNRKEKKEDIKNRERKLN